MTCRSYFHLGFFVAQFRVNVALSNNDYNIAASLSQVNLFKNRMVN